MDRYLHTATILNSGQILIAGGESCSAAVCTFLNSAELYNPATDTYTYTGSMAQARSAPAVLLNNGDVFIAGGYFCDDSNNCSSLVSAELYNPSAGTFISAGNMTVARGGQTMTLLNDGTVLIAGGQTCTTGTSCTALSSAEIYNPTVGTFTATANNMSAARYGASAVVLNSGQVLIVGGFDGNNLQPTAEIYSVALPGFTGNGGTLNTPLFQPTAALMNNGQVLVVGGSACGTSGLSNTPLALMSTGCPTNDAELYDPSANAFTETGGMNDSRWLQTATMLTNGQIVLAGGFSNGSCDHRLREFDCYWQSDATTELFDPVAIALSYDQSITAVAGQTATLMPSSGNVLIAGGIASGQTTTLEQWYSPPTFVPPNLESITVTPSAMALAPGQSQQYVAIGTLSNGATQTLQAVVWTSSVPSVAVISNASGNTGTVSAEQLGTTTITATAGSVGGSASLNVVASTSVALTSSANPMIYGSQVTFTATLNPPTASGTVIFSDGTSQLGTATVTGGSVTYTMSALAGGVHSITAFYSGDSNDAPALSQLLIETVYASNGTGPASMNTDRYLHTATMLNSGQILIAGGESCSSGVCTFLNSAELYNPASDTYTYTGSMAYPRSAPAVLLDNGNVLIAGGYTCDASGNCSSLSGAELYNPSAGTFTSAGNMTAPRGGQTMTLLADGTVLIAGGQTCTTGTSCTALSSAEIYDPVAGTFTAVASAMGAARYGASAVALNSGQVLIVGGFDGSNLQPIAEIYDLAVPGFTGNGPTLDTALFQPTATLLNDGQVLVAGGSACGISGISNAPIAPVSTGCPTNDAEIYDTSANTFTETGDTNDVRWLQTVTLLTNGELLIAGGLDDNVQRFGCVNCVVYWQSDGTTELFDPVAIAFNYDQSITGVAGQTATLLPSSGNVLIAGGIASGQTTAQEQWYQPSTFAPVHLVSVSVTPSALALSPGQSQQYLVIGTFSSGATQTLQTAVWTSSVPSVARVSNGSGNAGIVQAQQLGTTTIRAIVGAMSASVTLNVVQSTQITLSSSSNSPPYGSQVTFAATMVPTTATGTFAFVADGSIILGFGTVSDGSATYTSSTLAVGQHSITAFYSGDVNDTQGLSSPLTLTVLAPYAADLPASPDGSTPSSPAPDPGMKLFGAFEGSDIDSLNLTNLHLNLHIPLLSYPQRGGKLNLSFSIRYTPIPITYVCSKGVCSVGLPLKGDNPVPPFGPAVVPDFDLQSGESSTIVNNEQYVVPLVITPDGSSHPMGQVGSNYMTMDATGILLNSSGYIERNGVRHLYSPSGAKTFVEDTNGNQIAYNPANNNGSNFVSWTDTMGRTIAVPPSTVQSGSGLQGTVVVAPGSNSSTTDFTGCTGTLPIATAYLWSVPGGGGSSVNLKLCFVNVYVRTNLPGSARQYSGSLAQLQSIVLPDKTAWTFQYESADRNNPTSYAYGFLTQITRPEGGIISYSGWENNMLGLGWGGPIQRTVNANDGSGPHTWTYSYSLGSFFQTTQTTVVDPLGNETDHLFSSFVPQYETETKYYQGSASGGGLLKTVDTAYSYSTDNPYNQSNFTMNVVPISTTTTWPSGKVAKTQQQFNFGIPMTGYGVGYNALTGSVTSKLDYDYGNGASGTLLRAINTSYAAESPNLNYASYLANNLLDLPYSVQVADGGGIQQAYTYYGYDATGLQSSDITKQKVAGESYPGNQTSDNRWLNSSTTATTNCNVSVSNGYLVSKESYFDTGELQQATDPCGYTMRYGYSATYYGAYLTTITNALNQSTTYAYDFNTGLKTSTTDPNSQTKSMSYDSMDRLTQVSYPDGGSKSYCYTDLGGATCTLASAPPYAIVQTTAITSSLNQTFTTIFDGLGRVAQTQLNSDPSGVNYVDITYDANGRTSTASNPHRTAFSTTDGIKGYVYDALGRVCLVVPPDRVQVSQASGCPSTRPAGDRFIQYSVFPCTTVTDEVGNSRQSCVDGLGRVTSVVEDPGSSPHLNYSTIYTYNALGDLATITQNGSDSVHARKRTFTYDSLGQLLCAANPEVEIVNCPTSATGTFPSGVIIYAYDEDGNDVTKTSPSPNQASVGKTVITTYTYDKLNRLTGKSHADSYSSNPATAQALFGYDGNALIGCTTPPPGRTDSYPVGLRTSMCDGSGASSWTHDKMGRILLERRTIGSVTGRDDINAYNLDGSIQSVTALGYGVTYGYQGAGQPITAENSSDPFTYVSNAAYAPPGEEDSTTMGVTSSFSGIVTNNAYNDRLQPILIEASGSGVTTTVTSVVCNNSLGTCTATVSSSAGIVTGDDIRITGNSNNSLNATFAVAATGSGTVAFGFSGNNGISGTGGTMLDETASGVFLSLCYDFHLGVAITTPTPCSFPASASGDNGNVYTIVNARSGDSDRTESFSYDTLNRIATAQSMGAQWGEQYNIDAWGNLTSIGSISGKTYRESLSLSAPTADNQLSGFSYDAAGNMIANGSTSYFYDAENRLIWTNGSNLAQTAYVYDGDGQRVEKCATATATAPCPTSGSSGTLYWRGTSTDPQAETDLSGNVLENYIFFRGRRIARRDGATKAVHFYFSDHLGSHGVVENSTGTSCEQDIDYYPYGAQQHDYCPNVVQNYKFTGKERDIESGLDNFGARFDASSLGRFMTPDWAEDPEAVPFADLGDPQSLNLYSYVRNNPLSLVDEDGHAEAGANGGGFQPQCSPDPPMGCGSAIMPIQSQAISSARSTLSGPNQNTSWVQKLKNFFFSDPCGTNTNCVTVYASPDSGPVARGWLTAMAPIQKAADWTERHPLLILPVAIAAAAHGEGGPIEADELTAEEYISKYLKGQVRSEFPGQFLNSTIKVIQAAAKREPAARKAMKLMKDLRFKK